MGSNKIGSGKPINTGDVFHQLTVINESERMNGIRMAKCLCECGNFLYVRITNLFIGKTKSCGCRKHRKPPNYSHGESGRNGSAEYKVWGSIKRRCYNDKEISYKNYGGRGIKMSDEWLESYDSFLKDMGRRPNDNYSIERIDSNKNYCKENCRWATIYEQSNNKRNNVFISFLDKTMTLSQWARYFNTKYTTFRRRYLVCDSDMQKMIVRFYNKNIDIIC